MALNLSAFGEKTEKPRINLEAFEDSRYGVSQKRDPSSGRPLLRAPMTIPKTFNTDAFDIQIESPERTAVDFNPTVAQPLSREQVSRSGDRLPTVASQEIREELGASFDEHLDHRIALALGGSNVEENLELLPARENQKLGKKETELMNQVVKGEISLVDAQLEMAKAKGIDLPESEPRLKERIQNKLLMIDPRFLRIGEGLQNAVTRPKETLRDITNGIKQGIGYLGGIGKGLLEGVKDPKVLQTGLLNTFSALEQTASRVIDRLSDSPAVIQDGPVEERLKEISDSLNKTSKEDLENARFLGEGIKQLTLSDPESVGIAVIQNLPNMIGGLAVGGAGLLAGGPAGATTAMFGYSSALEGGFSRLEAEQLAEDLGKEVSENELDMIMVKVGVANGLLETFAPARFLNRMTNTAQRSILREVAQNVVQTGIEEAGTEFLQETVNNIVQREIDPERELFEGSLESGVVGGISGVLLGGAGPVARQTIRRGAIGLSVEDINQRIQELENKEELTPEEQTELQEIRSLAGGQDTSLTQSIQQAKASGQSFDEWVKGQERLFHGTAEDFTTLKSKRQLRLEGSDVEASNIAGDSPFVFLSENKKIAEGYALARMRNIRGTSRTIEAIPEGNIVDLTRHPVDYLPQERTVLGKIGKEMVEESGNRGPDAFIGGELMKIGKERKTFMDVKDVNLSFTDIEGSKLFEQKLREAGFSGFKFRDKTIVGGFSDSVAILPDKIKTRSQLKAEWDAMGELTISIREIEREVRNEVNEEIRKSKGELRKKLSFQRLIGDFRQGAINDAKKTLGIEAPISKMNLTELNDLLVELKTRLRFKRGRGFETPTENLNKLGIKPTKSPKKDFTEEFYQLNKEFAPSKTKRNFKIREDADTLLGSISTRLKNIDPSLKRSMRRFDFATLKQQQSSKKNIEPFIRSIKKEFSKDDYSDMDLAMKNGDIKKINELTEKYNVKEKYDNFRKEMNELHKRANKAGYDVGYLENYSPRMIKDIDGFIEYFETSDSWSVIKEAISRKETQLGRYLEKEEKAHLINTLLRGYRTSQITLSKSGSMKGRIIDFITPELNQFYYDVGTSIIRYTEEVNEKIEARKFFSKNRPVDKKEDQFNNIEDSIGFFTADLLAKDKITLTQEQQLRTILTSRFNPKGTHGLVGVYKNLAYIDVMGSPLNAITQIGDLALAMYRGGPLRAIKEAGKSAMNLSEVKKEELGIDEIAQELADSSKIARAVDTVLRLIGLTKVDTIGKEALINSVIGKWQALAQDPTERELTKLREVFGEDIEGSTWRDALEDLRSDNITENVKFLAFNELMDSQPLTLSEVPEAYVRGGNGRIFYQLKTWAIKILDIYRNEVIIEAKTDKVQAFKNLLRLTTLLVVMNATADELKDFLRGKKTPFGDRMIDQLLTIVGFSRYYTYQAEREGIGSALLDVIKPPTKAIDNLWKDGLEIKDSFSDYDKSVEINNFRTLRSLPLVGEFYYWWFGKGLETKERGQTIGVEIPGVEIEGIDVNIPNIEVEGIEI